MGILHLMSQAARQYGLRTSLQYFRCALTHHNVSPDDVERLFSTDPGFIRAECTRCHSPLLLRKDPSDREGNYYMLMER
jgi:hypothetical protein